MIELKQLAEKIWELRGMMHKLIDEKQDLLDPEIMAVSRMIDTLLNDYVKLIREKEGQCGHP